MVKTRGRSAKWLRSQSNWIIYLDTLFLWRPTSQLPWFPSFQRKSNFTCSFSSRGAMNVHEQKFINTPPSPGEAWLCEPRALHVPLSTNIKIEGKCSKGGLSFKKSSQCFLGCGGCYIGLSLKPTHCKQGEWETQDRFTAHFQGGSCAWNSEFLIEAAEGLPENKP